MLKEDLEQVTTLNFTQGAVLSNLLSLYSFGQDSAIAWVSKCLTKGWKRILASKLSSWNKYKFEYLNVFERLTLLNDDSYYGSANSFAVAKIFIVAAMKK